MRKSAGTDASASDLRQDAIWLASLDVKRLIAALPNGDFSAAVEQLAGVKGVTVDDRGLDVSRPITLVQFGIGEDQRRAVKLIGARPVEPIEGNADALLNSAGPVSLTTAIRIVIPTTNATKTRAAVELALSGAGAKDAGGGAYDLPHGRVEIGVTKDLVVVDAVLGETPKIGMEAMRARMDARVSGTMAQDGKAVLLKLSTP